MPSISNEVAILSLAWLAATVQVTRESATWNCKLPAQLQHLDGLPEASGVAASRRTPGVFWAHNDSGQPVLFALDDRGTVTGRVRLTGATVTDWEDIAVGSCPQGSCVHVADIGDNEGEREHITLYRAPEPAPGDAATVPAEAFHAAYPDGPHDAESLFVTRDGGVFIITKGDPGPVALYRFPRPFARGKTMTLERVGEPVAPDDVDVEAKDRPTSAAASADGRWVAVRTTAWMAFYRTADLTAGRWREAFRTDVSGLREPQGEGITFDASGGVVLVGEAGGVLRGAGSFARLACALE